MEQNRYKKDGLTDQLTTRSTCGYGLSGKVKGGQQGIEQVVFFDGSSIFILLFVIYLLFLYILVVGRIQIQRRRRNGLERVNYLLLATCYSLSLSLIALLSSFGSLISLIPLFFPYLIYQLIRLREYGIQRALVRIEILYLLE